MFADGVTKALGTSSGFQLGTASNQKLGFLGATPVVQQANSVDLGEVLSNFGLRASGGNPPLNLGSGALVAGTGTFSGTVTLGGSPSLNTTAGTAGAWTATAPAQTASAQAGVGLTFTASNAVAGSSNAGAAAGGDVTFVAGDAARLTSGNANGGNIVLKTGNLIGSGAYGLHKFTVNGLTDGQNEWQMKQGGANNHKGYLISRGNSDNESGVLHWTGSGGTWQIGNVGQGDSVAVLQCQGVDGMNGSTSKVSIRGLNGPYFKLSSDSTLRWNDQTGLGSGTDDVVIGRDAADTLYMRRGTNAQTVRIYGTFTDASNYTRASLSDNGSGIVTLAAQTAGTGTDDIDIAITPAGAGLLKFGTHSAVGAETISGYITVKDAAGNSRKLAVIS